MTTHAEFDPERFVITNVKVYREIALEAAAVAESALLPRHGPIPLEGSAFESYVEPGQQSFKSGMIAIVFAGMYVEARLWLAGIEALGEQAYARIDRQPLEQRPEAIGVRHANLREALQRFREARKDLVHEKALPRPRDTRPVQTAQEGAARAKKLIELFDTVFAAPDAL